MKVLLVKDIFKLGRAGDVRKVADGYGRNFLIPQGMAIKATPNAMKQADRIRSSAEVERTKLNSELSSVAEAVEDITLAFPMKAGEMGKLYGSITSGMIAEAIEEQSGIEVDKRQIDIEPIKTLGVHSASIRMTIDLVPEVTVLVHREGEPPESAYAIEEDEVEAEEGVFADLQADLEAEAKAEAEAIAEEEQAAVAAEEEQAGESAQPADDEDVVAEAAEAAETTEVAEAEEAVDEPAADES